MARRNLLDKISSNPALAEGWRPQTMAERQEEIQHQVASSAEILVPIESVQLTFTFTPNGRPLRHFYDPEQTRQWAEADIAVNGIRSPLWVRPSPTPGSGQYELVAGMRRYLAAQHLNHQTVPVEVFNWSDEAAYQAAAGENFNRKNFSPVEELDHGLYFLSQALNTDLQNASALLSRMANASKGRGSSEILESEEARIVEQVFGSMGLTWKTFVQSRLPLRSKPPEVLTAIREGELSLPKAEAISRLKDEAVRNALLEAAVTERLTLETIQSRVEEIQQHLPQPIQKQRPERQFYNRAQGVVKQLKSAKLPAPKLKKVEKLIAQLEELLKDPGGT